MHTQKTNTSVHAEPHKKCICVRTNLEIAKKKNLSHSAHLNKLIACRVDRPFFFWKLTIARIFDAYAIDLTLIFTSHTFEIFLFSFFFFLVNFLHCPVFFLGANVFNADSTYYNYKIIQIIISLLLFRILYTKLSCVLDTS